MAPDNNRLSTSGIAAFLSGRRIHAFDPDTQMSVAFVNYDVDGQCFVTFVDGQTECGRWGLSDGAYWTQYEQFRDGARCAFYLVPISPDAMQAFHSDGTRAFLQSHLEKIGQ